MPHISKRLLAILSVSLLWAAMPEMGHAQITITANFDGGNSSSVADAYPGIGAAGWAGPWEEMRSNLAGLPYTNFVVRTAGDSGYDDPYTTLGTSSGNYLYVDANVNSSSGGYGTIARNYAGSSGIDLTQPHTIDFLYRVDEGAGAISGNFTSVNDRYQIYDYPTIRGGSTGGCGWLIGAYGGSETWLNSADVGYWTFYDGAGHLGDTGFYASRQVNTGIRLTAGQTLSFHLEIDPVNKLWDATVTDVYNPSKTFTRTGMGWRIDTSAATGDPNATVSGTMQFCGRGNLSNDERQIALDSLNITGEQASNVLPTESGFRGIWYSIPASSPYKYSGGLGTYCQQIAPHAYYSEESNKTFFVYGGTNQTNSTLYHMVSYYDHETGQVARPRRLLDKATTDAHDNPAIMLDDQGYIYIFSNSHSTLRPAYISRSAEPYSIDAFDRVLSLPSGTNNNFSYSQPLYIEGQGFMFLHTLYTSSGRTLCYNTSSDGINWDHDWNSRPEIARMPGGQYQVSEAFGQKVGTAFNYHPDGVVNERTNLYYMQSTDMGTTWTSVDGTELTTPVTTVTNAALVHDYQSEGLLVYLKDVQYDADGDPILFYMTSHDALAGPAGNPRMFHTAHWDVDQWIIKDAFASDHNYDFGPLYIEDDGTWRVIAPTDPGPEPWGTGGEMEMWISNDEGDTWEKIRQLTHDSDNNHTYARQPRNVHDGFYAFWADGDALTPSDSQLYFTDRLGTGVWKLPEYMDGDFATPEFVDASIGAPVPGDANGDGKVDEEDGAILAENWMKSTYATWSDGDFNRDGHVDATDASIMAANWGHGTSESNEVPEPCLAMLLLSAGLFVPRNRSARRSGSA